MCALGQRLPPVEPQPELPRAEIRREAVDLATTEESGMPQPHALRKRPRHLLAQNGYPRGHIALVRSQRGHKEVHVDAILARGAHDRSSAMPLHRRQNGPRVSVPINYLLRLNRTSGGRREEE
jgi:hypothetical protein